MSYEDGSLLERTEAIRQLDDWLDKLRKGFALTGLQTWVEGPSDAIRHLAKQSEDLQRLTYSLHGVGDPWREFAGPLAETGLSSHVFRQLGYAERQSNLLVAASGSPLQDLSDQLRAYRQLVDGPGAKLHQLASLFRPPELERAIALARGTLEAHPNSFRLPASTEFDRLGKEMFAANDFSSRFLGAAGQAESLAAMKAMRSPWVDNEQEIASSRAFGDLMAIGRGLAERMPFEREWADGLRSRLGDWRDPIADMVGWQSEPPRVAFYRERGLDSALTHFPTRAFYESAALAGLRRQEIGANKDDNVDDAVARSRRTFDRLLELELSLRRFISDAMVAEFGEGWARTQLPNGMYDDWIDKRNRALDAGQNAGQLIEYADFTHYKSIIERKDNWQRVFRRVFRRQEDVRESFQRMFPLRVAVAHARFLTNDDELLLLVESRRLLNAIGAWVSRLA